MKKFISAAVVALLSIAVLPAHAADKKADAKVEKKAEKKAEKKK
jgi:uncharacterized membrane protein